MAYASVTGPTPWGRPVPIIQWEIKPEDYTAIRAATDRILSGWSGKNVGFPELRPTDETEAGSKPHDAYHPVGLCYMGVDDEAVVAPDLKVHGTHNLSVLSTAVFPSAGTANPTFSMLCLADSLADRLKNDVTT